jgi:hypothetical protein
MDAILKGKWKRQIFKLPTHDTCLLSTVSIEAYLAPHTTHIYALRGREIHVMSVVEQRQQTRSLKSLAADWEQDH